MGSFLTRAIVYILGNAVGKCTINNDMLLDGQCGVTCDISAHASSEKFTMQLKKMPSYCTFSVLVRLSHAEILSWSVLSQVNMGPMLARSSSSTCCMSLYLSGSASASSARPQHPTFSWQYVNIKTVCHYNKQHYVHRYTFILCVCVCV